MAHTARQAEHGRAAEIYRRLAGEARGNAKGAWACVREGCDCETRCTVHTVLREERVAAFYDAAAVQADRVGA